MSGKLALKYQGTEIEAMKQVAQASKNRSLAEFQTVRSIQITFCDRKKVDLSLGNIKSDDKPKCLFMPSP